MGDRGSLQSLCYISLAWVFLINYRHSCESLILSDNPKKNDDSAIYQNISFLLLSPLYITLPPPPHTHPIPPILFSFRLPSSSLSAWMRCSTRLTPVSSYHRLTWGPVAYDVIWLWPLPSQMQLPSMYEEEKELRFSLQKMVASTKKYIFIYFYRREFKIMSPLLWSSVLHCHLQHPTSSISSSSSFSLSWNSHEFDLISPILSPKKVFFQIKSQLFFFIETLM